MKNKKLIVILGPTASGKTKLAVKLAAKYRGEIVSADSRQVYRGMDIGTGKDLSEYTLKNRRRKQNIKHYLIDVVSPKGNFNVAKYQKLAYTAIDDILARKQRPFLVGGSGLYLEAVVKGYQFPQNKKSKIKNKNLKKQLEKLSLPQLLARLKKIDSQTYKIIDKKNRRRVERALEIYYETGQPKSQQLGYQKPAYDVLVLGLKMPLAKIYQKIDARLAKRLKEGMIDEVKTLHRQGVSWKKLDAFGLEYRYVSRYLRGQISQKQMLEELKNAIHHLAKRQMTWFKRNKDIIWISDLRQADQAIKKFLIK